MNIFNSLGSNYDFSFVLKSLFSFSQDSKKLENILEEKYGGNAILLYKGRQALELGLKSLNLPSDSFVAINGFTCFAVYEAVKKAGLNVELLDIEKGELNFSAETLEKPITKNPLIKAVIIQNTLGYPCDIEYIDKICRDKKIILIEDLAHCVGTKYRNGKEAGTVGDMEVLSFSQDKIIDGISGGALISQKESSVHLRGVDTKKQVIDRLYPMFTYFIRNTYKLGLGKVLHYFLKRLNLLSGPMDQPDGLHQLPLWYCNLVKMTFDNLQNNLDHRKRIAFIYGKNLNPKIISPKILSSVNLSSNLRFPIFVNNRESLISHLKQSGVYVSDIWYDDIPNHCPNAQLAAEEILNLPTHLNISENDAIKISNLINRWLKLQ